MESGAAVAAPLSALKRHGRPASRIRMSRRDSPAAPGPCGEGRNMKLGKYAVLRKRHLAAALALLFLLAVLVVIAAAAIPYAYANAVASAGRRQPICCTDRSNRVVSLPFNADGGQDNTAELLAVLGRHNARATFFVTGEWAERFGGSAKALHDAGQEVMNLSDTYLHMPGLSREEMIREINACSDKIQAVTGARPTLFRAPYGDYSDALLETTEMFEIPCIQWDVDAQDQQAASAGEISRRVVSQAASGSIVLLHVGAENTPEALDQILQELRDEGYTFLPVSEMIYTENFLLSREGRQIAQTG